MFKRCLYAKLLVLCPKMGFLLQYIGLEAIYIIITGCSSIYDNGCPLSLKEILYFAIV